MASAMKVENEQQSDETFEFLCSVCKGRGKNTEAEKYCVDCHDYYCLQCVRFHEDVPALSGHKILKKGDSGQKGKLPVAPTERCEKHRFKVVDMYCKNHDEVGCGTCIAVNHRSCKDVFDIPEYVLKTQTTTDTKSTKTELNKSKRLLTEIIETSKKEIEKLLKDKEDFFKTLYDFRKEINDRLDELEERSRTLIEEKCKVLQQNIEKDRQSLETSLAKLESAIDCCALSGNNASQLFVCSKKGQQALELAKGCCEEISIGKKTNNLYFRKEHKLSEILKEIHDLGKIRQSTDMYVLANKNQLCIRHRSDTEDCNISSACVLEDGSILLADIGNKKLKRTNRIFSIVDILDLPEAPGQISPVDKETVAVISYGVEAIILISCKDNMKKIKQITTNQKCYGITSAHGKLYVTDPHTCVIVYSMSGTKLNAFSKDQSGQSGRKLFHSLYGLAVSDDGMRIYVTDTKYGLVILNKDGTLQGKYDCTEVSSPTRVCVADNGTVLVSGYINNCILQFTSDGKKLGNIMASDTENKNCGAVCFDQRRCQLLVGRPGKDIVNIYDIK